MKRIYSVFVIALVLSLIPSLTAVQGQEKSTTKAWELQATNTEASLRGLHVLSDKIVWVSGSGGTVLRTVDSGKTWTKRIVEGAEDLDFRDIHAFDEKSAVILSAGAPARVYRTTDAGRTWEKAFEHTSEKAFFDAISFWDETNGIAMSDPIDDRILLIRTSDGGKSWEELNPENRPKASPGEGGFAASGTNMVVLPSGRCLIALGSALKDEQFKESRVVYSDDQGKTWSVAQVPMPRNQSTGIFSMAFANDKIGIAVGGDYLKPERTEGNVAVTLDGGLNWKRPTGEGPSGYRSGVAVFKTDSKIVFATVGTNGTDISMDNGSSWKNISSVGFHAIQFAPNSTIGWASGGQGRIGKWTYK